MYDIDLEECDKALRKLCLNCKKHNSCIEKKLNPCKEKKVLSDLIFSEIKDEIYYDEDY